MAERKFPSADGRIAVIDLGSNSLRLVVFERLGGALFPLLNEKVLCGLARGQSETGRLNPEGVALALANLRRFVELARAITVDSLAVLATAAIRDAEDGPAFAAEIARRCGVEVRIVEGGEEARLSAAGVLAGIPEADGLVADLGGGSIELVDVGRLAAEGRIGDGLTLPLGPLRLAQLGDSTKGLSDIVERRLADAPMLSAARGRSLYLVGGSARAIARLHMEQTRYPLHVIHHYEIARADAEAFFDVVARQSRKSLARITTISPKRLEVVPVAALILRRLVAAAAPRRVVFSAFGLREGYAYGLLPADSDPLIASCAAIARRQSRFVFDGDWLQRWTEPLFFGLDEPARRLHRAACWLSDVAWSEHPDYRARQAFARALTLPFAGVTHAGRVFVAAVLHARYGGAGEDPFKEPTQPLLAEAEAETVRPLGLALRLAYTLCGGALDLLSDVRLGRDGSGVVLEVPAEGSLFVGEVVQRRLDALGRALGSRAMIRRVAPRRSARA